MSAHYRQDMPPEQGYGTIDVARKGARRYFSNRTVLAAFIGISVYGLWDVKKVINKANLLIREKDNTFIALEPFLTAENDRAFLKQLIANRDEEADLMKNVPGWKVGTLFGEPFYKTTPSNRLDPVKLASFYVHRPQSDVYDNVYSERVL